MKIISRRVISIILILFSINSFSADIILREMKVQDLSHEWRFTFSLSAPTNYRTFTLQNPLRYIVDLRNVTTTAHLRYKEILGTPIQSFRSGAKPDNIFRMVFDLKRPVDSKVVVLPASDGRPARLQVVFKLPAKKVAAFSWPSTLKKTSLLEAPEDTAFHQPVTLAMSADKKKLRNIIVVIDPGHGGKDNGATGSRGTHEKNVVLAISKDLYALVNQQRGFSAVLTRNSDYYISLRQRLAIARQNHADMFVAIHADAYRNTAARGVSIFALSTRGATSEAARWLAKRENNSELMGGVALSDQSHLLQSVLINLSQSATIRASLEIGYDMMRSVQQVTRMHRARVEQAAFVVLKSPDIPSLLVETGFITNPIEERRLNSAGYQQQIARSVMQGIREYFIEHPPRFTWLAYWRNHGSK